MKFVIVGDSGVGKTPLLTTFIEGVFPLEYVPTVFDIKSTEVTVKGQKVKLYLHDTTGLSDYEAVRVIAYPETDCFLLCFSLCNKESLASVQNKWYPEIRQHCPNAPIILVGTMLDIRQDTSKQKDPSNIVSSSEGEKTRKSLKAVKYVECSALTQEGLKEVFEKAVKTCLSKK
ncbi:ras-related protein ced-10-like isoform X1 [Biomphalaria glabrata]|uniref:Ras-related protein ced-10-like isoform X1 n=1 Tax=Biomphalaria glabrata TaxID=6526 RepID=A0A9W2YXZ4_BIOGL|nr:ras-related protein ced-10-like isoform X1 [Biomphalaria glabrata]XP_055867508.1 ras-related protein ced-10-like isoform X1 [Biomphalaria glabrata]XP_055867509.1 ras-related protein ced-10-like isoform X1 [Biomphalaria glabrata]XP_055867510.1 ras-related protein ced-10-like isoform X1 [Biomphalaria glabrata]XP_055867511.1 ras-related protein ced-10-like isoform X1 [Biomphalaria glabrata]XP_055867512.1 ras-related protein ced-10-like isoform X1 [Biomphalaria glabrata]